LNRWTPVDTFNQRYSEEKREEGKYNVKGGTLRQSVKTRNSPPSGRISMVDTWCPPGVSTDVAVHQARPLQHPITGLWWVELDPGEWEQKKQWERRPDGGWRFAGMKTVCVRPQRAWGGFGRRQRWARTREAAEAAIRKAQAETPWELK
jgi:hypothetical protein